MNKKLLALGIAAGAAASVILLKSSKVAIPDGATAVSPFDVKKYLGTWYEIARMDYRFERRLSNVSATYTVKGNGDIKVDNKGYSAEKQAWRESIGKAKFVKNANQGRLKVSFYGPFYAGYNIIDLDEQYKYALVAGNNLNYLWILSRKTTIPAKIKERFLAKAKELGYDTEALIWTKHNKQD
jgi:apolipoprotein D and lipocalin family protein